MITIALLAVILLLLAATPWRRLSVAGRLWAGIALVNTVAFFGLPATAATSPWRPLVGRVVAASAFTSLALLVLGLILWRRHNAPGNGGTWAALLILGALPVVLYGFFWLIGPLY